MLTGISCPVTGDGDSAPEGQVEPLRMSRINHQHPLVPRAGGDGQHCRDSLPGEICSSRLCRTREYVCVNETCWKGKWWVPGAPGDAKPGTLHYRDDGQLKLELIGGFDILTPVPGAVGV